MRKIIRYHRIHLMFLIYTFGLYFYYVFNNIISIKPSGLYAGHQNVWSDWTLHISIANIFAYKNPEFWFSYHPIYSQGKFTYPFLTDFISGMLIKSGLSLPVSFILPSIIFILILLISIYFLFYLLFKSRNIPIIAIFIFIFSSGLGFYNFILDFIKNPNFANFLYPIKEYSSFNIYDWYVGNVVVGLLIPQRSFLMGMAFGVSAILCLTYVLLRPNIKSGIKYYILFFGGIFAGILPITHAHSFIAVVIITSIICLINYRKMKMLALYYLPAFVISATLYLIFINGGIENKSFFAFLPGWTSKDIVDFIIMWVKIWGLMIPISILSFIILIKNNQKYYASFFIGFFVIFILANLILFQPVRWDNTKLFWWAYLGFSGLASYLIIKMWKKQIILQVLAIMLLFSLTFTGVLELIKLGRIDQHTFQLTSTEDINLGVKIRSYTSPLDVFLTAPSHNHIVMIWGNRPILLGYTAWVWNFGFNYAQTELDIKDMYLGTPNTKQLLKKYKVDYVFIGPTEINDLNANENFFKTTFPIKLKGSNSTIYDVRNLLKPD